MFTCYFRKLKLVELTLFAMQDFLYLIHVLQIFFSMKKSFLLVDVYHSSTGIVSVCNYCLAVFAFKEPYFNLTTSFVLLNKRRLNEMTEELDVVNVNY